MINLTPEQQVIYDKVLTFVSSPIGGMCLISGPAGVGKTFLVGRLINDLEDEKIIVSAPTHKAVKTLKLMAMVENKKVPFCTIHSAMALREKIDGYGKVSYVAEKGAPKKVDGMKILVLDEASMLQDDLFYLLVPYAKFDGLKIIFVGDPVQIPPIGKLNSMPFSEDTQRKFNIEVHNLTTIIRQAEGHPIIAKSLEIRNRLSESNCIIDRTDALHESGNVYFMKRGDAFDKFIEYFDSPKFKENSDRARIISWTNQRVDEYNDIIRSIIYKQHAALPKLVVGEKLIIESPVMEGKRVIFNNNDEVEVIDLEIKYEYIRESKNKIKYYFATVEYETEFFKNISHKIKIIHEDSEYKFNKLVNEAASKAKKMPQGTYNAQIAWVAYYKLKRYFNDVSYGYSSTVHKAQGSTYLNCFVDEADICYNSNIVERNRILYTSLTRGKHNIFILS